MKEKKLIVIADSHLGSTENDVELMIQYIDTLNPRENELIFLGDLFHIWAAPVKYHSGSVIQLLDAIKSFNDNGGISHLVVGNRDIFFQEHPLHNLSPSLPFHSISKEFLKLNRNGKRLFFHHGDTVNSKDTQYLRWRKIVRSKLFQLCFKLIPAAKVKKIMKDAELAFKTTNKAFRITFPEQEWSRFLKETYQKYQPDFLFIGHFHPEEPVITEWKSLKGVVVPDWMKDYSFLEIDSDLTFHFKKFEKST